LKIEFFLFFLGDTYACWAPIKLHKTIQEYDFSLLAKKEKHARTRIRLLGLDHLKKGKTARETAEFLCVHENSVKRWLKSFILDSAVEMTHLR
jgi:hypothetical protein